MNSKTSYIVKVAMLSAVSAVLMFFSFSVPLMPSFIKMDFSELPALLAAFSMGPVAGVMVCFVKNLVNLLSTTTGGVGELANFILGVCFVFPAGYIYSKVKTKKGALAGSLAGAFVMALLSLPINYYVTYPIYATFMPIDAIIAMYQAIMPGANGLLQCLVIFNLPYTFIKGVIVALVTFLIYKRLSPLLHK